MKSGVPDLQCPHSLHVPVHGVMRVCEIGLMVCDKATNDNRALMLNHRNLKGPIDRQHSHNLNVLLCNANYNLSMKIRYLISGYALVIFLHDRARVV